jgi:hypothetical protein
MSWLLDRRFILVLSAVSLICFIVGWVSAANTIHCYQTPASGSGQVGSGAGSGISNSGAFIAGVLGIVGFLAMLYAWLCGLVKTARIQAWGWFVAIFLLPPVGSLFYGAFGPDQPREGKTTYIEDSPNNPVIP